MGSLVQIPCLERQSSSVGQVRKWSNFSQKTGNKDVISVPTTVTQTLTCLKTNCMLDTSVTILQTAISDFLQITCAHGYHVTLYGSAGQSLSPMSHQLVGKRDTYFQIVKNKRFCR